MSNTNFNYNFINRKKNPKISLDSRSKDTLYSALREAQNTSNELRNIDFAGKNASDMTDDEIKITASRYNIGPEPEKNAIVTDYGQDIYDNKDEILEALGL